MPLESMTHHRGQKRALRAIIAQAPLLLQGNQNNRPREPYKSHFSPRKLKKDCPLAPGNWTIMPCKKPSRPKEAQEQKPCISALLVKLYLRLCPREARIPEIKLLMPLVGLSLPERSGGDTPHQEHSQHMPPSFPMPGVYAKVLYIWYPCHIMTLSIPQESLHCHCPILIL